MFEFQQFSDSLDALHAPTRLDNPARDQDSPVTSEESGLSSLWNSGSPHFSAVKMTSQNHEKSFFELKAGGIYEELETPLDNECAGLGFSPKFETMVPTLDVGYYSSNSSVESRFGGKSVANTQQQHQQSHFSGYNQQLPTAPLQKQNRFQQNFHPVPQSNADNYGQFQKDSFKEMSQFPIHLNNGARPNPQAANAMYPVYPAPRPLQQQPYFQQMHQPNFQHQQMQQHQYQNQQVAQFPQQRHQAQSRVMMPSYAALGDASRVQYPPRNHSIPISTNFRPQSAAYNQNNGASFKNNANMGGFTDVNGSVYVVQFKNANRYYMLDAMAPQHVTTGDFVVVDGDRGEDMGVVTEVLSMVAFIERKYLSNASLDEEENSVGRIMRIATVHERQQLPAKFHDEKSVVKYCAEIISSLYVMPMVVLDAEFQFDRHKLTIFYDATARIDFRELVRDLYSTYKTRIWMKQVDTSRPFYPKQYAVMALATGVQFNPDNRG